MKIYQVSKKKNAAIALAQPISIMRWTSMKLKKTGSALLTSRLKILKLPLSNEDKKSIYTYIKQTRLYDEKLSIYKLNAPLMDTSSEIGRARAFIPEWLEDQIITKSLLQGQVALDIRSGLVNQIDVIVDTSCL